MVGEPVGEAAFDDVAPVRALAPVVGQSLEQRGLVHVGVERHEVDDVVAEVTFEGFDGCSFGRSAF